jgi:hypothetical protein
MEIVKNRTLEAGQEVFVYFNLHKKLFSVKDVKTGLVVAHTDSISLEEATFKVSEAGRQRVLREQKKNVHAGVRGKYMKANLKSLCDKGVTYNPYKYDSFVEVETGERIETASLVRLENKKIYI